MGWLNLPERVQRSRRKGAKLRSDVIYAGRPSRWGNPLVGQRAGRWYRTWIRGSFQLGEIVLIAKSEGQTLSIHGRYAALRKEKGTIYRERLVVLRRARFLACWC